MEKNKIIKMDIKELDSVELKSNGMTYTVFEAYPEDDTYVIDLNEEQNNGDDFDWKEISSSDVERVMPSACNKSKI